MEVCEVINKWSMKHRNALNSVLCFIEINNDSHSPKLYFPSTHYKAMVTDQIFHDLGYKKVKVLRSSENKKIAYVYVKYQDK